MVLRYINPFLEARRAGLVSDHIHLGYWSEPPATPVSANDWTMAQNRLVSELLDMADLQDGQDIVDMACGIGGTVRAISRRIRPSQLVALNIDARQLELCPGAEEGVSKVRADAVAPPFGNGTFDRVFCVEAAFHFSSRKRFLEACFDMLRSGGRIILADILVDPRAENLRIGEKASLSLKRDFGPWPEMWLKQSDLRQMLSDAGFEKVELWDVTSNTLPSYEIIAPTENPAMNENEIPATHAMKILHTTGSLSYVFACAEKA